MARCKRTQDTETVHPITLIEEHTGVCEKITASASMEAAYCVLCPLNCNF